MADTRRSEAGSCGLYSGDGVDTCACSTTGTLFFALTGMILGYSDEIDGVVKKGRIFSSAKGKHNVWVQTELGPREACAGWMGLLQPLLLLLLVEEN